MNIFVYFFSFLVLYKFPMINTQDINFGENLCEQFGVSFYKDIGCEQYSGGSMCPTFSCNDRYQKGFCLYHNGIYKNGEVVKEHRGLDRNCKCNVKDGISKINCQIKTFTEAVSNELKRNQEICKNNDKKMIYKLKIDCSNLKKEATCKVDGKILNRGDKYNSKKACHECICLEDSIEDSIEEDYNNCFRTPCETVLTKLDEIGNKCAPVYVDEQAIFKSNLSVFELDKYLCCPSRFLCEKDILEMTKTSSRIDRDIERPQACTFGEIAFDEGEVYKVSYANSKKERREVICVCNLSPFPTCFETTAENEDSDKPYPYPNLTPTSTPKSTANPKPTSDANKTTTDPKPSSDVTPTSDPKPISNPNPSLDPKPTSDPTPTLSPETTLDQTPTPNPKPTSDTITSPELIKLTSVPEPTADSNPTPSPNPNPDPTPTLGAIPTYDYVEYKKDDLNNGNAVTIIDLIGTKPYNNTSKENAGSLNAEPPIVVQSNQPTDGNSSRINKNTIYYLQHIIDLIRSIPFVPLKFDPINITDEKSNDDSFKPVSPMLDPSNKPTTYTSTSQINIKNRDDDNNKDKDNNGLNSEKTNSIIGSFGTKETNPNNNLGKSDVSSLDLIPPIVVPSNQPRYTIQFVQTNNINISVF